MEGSEQPEKDLGQKSEKGVNRRKFLKVAGVGGLAAAAVGINLVPFNPLDSKYAEYHNTPGFELEQEIENKFDIILAGERVGSFGEIIDGGGWSVNQLKVIEDTLSYLPKHFYEPSDWGPWKRKLTFSIKSHSSLALSSGFCSCGALNKTKQGGDVITFTPGAIHSSYMEDSFDDLTHELIHRVNPRVLLSDVKIIFGRNFAEVRAQLKKVAQERLVASGIDIDQFIIQAHKIDLFDPAYRKKMKDLDRGEGGRLLRYGTFAVDQNPDELLAVVGSSYAFGKDYFYKAWLEFFTEEEVDKLYEYNKTKIYRRKEYGPLPFDSK